MHIIGIIELNTVDYQVSHTPKRHAAVVFEAGQFGADQHYGHVAFVEKVNSDGSMVL